MRAEANELRFVDFDLHYAGNKLILKGDTTMTTKKAERGMIYYILAEENHEYEGEGEYFPLGNYAYREDAERRMNILNAKRLNELLQHGSITCKEVYTENPDFYVIEARLL